MNDDLLSFAGWLCEKSRYSKIYTEGFGSYSGQYNLRDISEPEEVVLEYINYMGGKNE